MSIKDKVAIIGMGCTKFGENWDMGPNDMIIDAAHEAFRAATPIAADDTLESARWDYLDSLEFGRYFNIESLALYLLKLKVLVRKEGLIIDRGRAGFEGILEGRKEEIGALMEEEINAAFHEEDIHHHPSPQPSP